MLLDIDSFLDEKVKDLLSVCHYEKKVDSYVVPVKRIGSKFKKLIIDEYGAKFLNEADYILTFHEKEETPPIEDKDEKENTEEENVEDSSEETSDNNDDTLTTDEPSDDEEGDEKEMSDAPSDDEGTTEFGVDDNDEDGTPTNKPIENTDSTEDTEEDTEEDKKKKEELNENIKIQDLTKTMLSTPKVKTPKSSTTTTTKTPKSSTTKSNNKTNSKPKAKKQNLEEAETEASGVELRSKIQTKVLEKLFKSQLNETNKIELYDLKNVNHWFFAKVTLKSRETQKSSES